MLLWWLDDHPKLSAECREAISDPGNIVSVSAATIWEIEIKHSLGKLTLPQEWYDAICEESFQRLPITWEHSRKAGQLPAVHRDPFDRILVAQAFVEGLILVTHDEQLQRYAVKVMKT